ncbi:MAG: hypothetical protein D6768_08365 [Chloroflexi bacterium]|nr:MAG: hypothetical protein D6768_08365 [Chloroflexota bacterium]
MTPQTLTIGWVLRASTTGFIVGCRVLQPGVPQFGDLVKVPLPNTDTDVFGLIYDVQVRDDPAVRQLILAGEMEPEAMLDQRENRLVPIEIGVLVVGYRQNEHIFQGLSPQPPLSLDVLTTCSNAELREFTRELVYLRLILNAGKIPADELIVAHLRRAASAYPPETRRAFLVGAGREIAQLLNFDLGRLDSILKRIRPVEE